MPGGRKAQEETGEEEADGGMRTGINLGKPIAPCKGCMRRNEACHGACEEYRMFREALDATNRSKAEHYQGMCNTADIKHRNAVKFKRYRWRLRKG